MPCGIAHLIVAALNIHMEPISDAQTFIANFSEGFLVHFPFLFTYTSIMPVLLEQQELIDIAVGVGIFSASLMMVGGLFSWTSAEAEARREANRVLRLE
jgi:hypothetical protein